MILMSRLRGSIRTLLGIALLMVGVAIASCASDVASSSDPSVLPTNGRVPVNRAFIFEVGSLCGVGRLGLPVDGRFWITDEAKGESEWMPPEWAATQNAGANLITVTVKLLTDGGQLAATLAGRTVVYRPVSTSDPVVPCA